MSSSPFLLQISHIKIADIPDVDLSNVGVTKFGSFIVEVIDPVSDYLELLETAFDFQLIKGLLPRQILGILLLAEVITHIESKPVDSAIVHCLVGFFKDELGPIPSAFTFAADNTVPGCWIVFPCFLYMSSGGNKDIPETSSPAAKRGKKGTMKGKKPKYVIKLPLQKAPVVESPIVQPNPSEAENVVPIPSQPSAVELTHSQPSIVQPMPSQPPIVQPMQPNINQLMPSQPLPSSIGSQCAAARCTSLSCSSQQNASPISMPSRDNQNILQVDQQMSTETGEPSTVVDNDPAVGAVLEIIEPCFTQAELPLRQSQRQLSNSLYSHGRVGVKSRMNRKLFSLKDLRKIEEQKLVGCIGGKNPKGRVYGVGKLNEGYLSRETFTQQTSSSAADSQKIIRLEEDIRQSREENQRSQRKLESLVNVVLPILPPAAQIILQDMNEQPQNDHQNQNHAREGEQHDGHSSSPHYADY
ncbi:hypothetical protein Fmac_008049 [Flemingia macrophylla]|uniref:Uncharacterized protein n=1 Tax=Flemingia macrophylla TaxID=520843 RepID=A0ABD1MWE1_9FABA